MERTPYFAETAVGAVVLIGLQFLSLPILVGGLALLGIARLVLKSRRGPRASGPRRRGHSG